MTSLTVEYVDPEMVSEVGTVVSQLADTLHEVTAFVVLETVLRRG